jgi:hypothetical protein
VTGLTETELRGLVGHRFAGGRYRIEHWENWLLTDCTGREPLPDGLVHPIVLFHVPILGVGTSITELFELGGVSGPGSVGLEGYDWEYFGPLHEDVEYRMEGGIVSVERITDDEVVFRNYEGGRFTYPLRSRPVPAAIPAPAPAVRAAPAGAVPLRSAGAGGGSGGLSRAPSSPEEALAAGLAAAARGETW